ncbi:hypothetical protein T439DRAFT_106245 [Meredithblackwellia eburnea MCA 4105]
MAKASTRFRNRKINFKTRITVRVGAHALDLDLDDEANESSAVEFEEESKASSITGVNGGKDKPEGHVETGVDKEEEHELHLQQVLAATSKPTKGISANASIPTPDSKVLIDEAVYKSLYKSNVWTDTFTPIRFSDTVEDAMKGAVDYTMDDEDEEWLEAFNKTLAATSSAAGSSATNGGAAAAENGKPLDPVPNGSNTPAGGRGARDRKGKGKNLDDASSESGAGAAVATGPISDDDFELVMQLMEKTAEEKAPMAHVDIESLPTLADMEAAFVEQVWKPPVDHLKGFAKSIYPWWKERKEKRGGKSIIPQLDYDESNENNPYVCFRRRELKSSRKTRRSDQQNHDRLIRLRNDLYAAHALMVKTRDRERLKLESFQAERRIFEARVEMRDLKRRLGEAEGDEDLLIGRREKKRKREEVGPPGSANGMRVQLRKPDANFSPQSLITPMEELKQRKERALNIQTKMERDLAKKKEQDQSWEDWTDGAYLARPPSNPARYWRAVEPLSGMQGTGFANQYQPALGHVRSCFRRRVGRGGRVLLDRIAPGRGVAASGRGGGARAALRTLASDSDESDLESSGEEEEEEEEEDPYVAARRAERFRYDSDATLDFLSADAPVLIDDFEFKYALKRATLFKGNDTDFLTPDSSYLDEAYRWVSQEPERPQPPVVYGRPQPRPPMQVQPGGPGAVPMQVPGGAPQAQAYGQMQMMAAASQAHRLAQHQAHLKRQQANGGSPTDPMRKAPSTNGSPIGQGQQLPMPLPLPMPMPMNGTPVQAQWMNGVPTTKDGSPLPPNFQQQLQLQQAQQAQQQLHLPPQRLPNGLVAIPNGSNGLPATSRLSAPPFSNPQQAGMQLSPQPQGSPHQMASSSPLPPGMQPRPTSAASNHQLGQQQIPSRPGSAASSHHSPNLQAQTLPGQPLMSPGGMHQIPNGKRSSPSMHANFPQMQAGTPVMKQMQPLPYGGGFVAQS